MSTQDHNRPIPLEMRAKLAAAISTSGLRLNLDRILGPATPPAPAARQTVPNAANLCQSAPQTRKLQNEPTDPANQCQRAPNAANARHTHEICETNPTPRPPRPLTPDQLRAAHLLVAGHSTTDIAATLQLNRHTLARWKRLPLFQRELRRLVLQPRAATSPPPDPASIATASIALPSAVSSSSSSR